MLKMRYDRLQRTALMVRLAKVSQASVRLRSQAVLERGGQARLADAWFAGQKHDAAFTVLDLRPTALQQLHLFLAADQWRAAFRAQRFEAAGDGALTDDAPSRHR